MHDFDKLAKALEDVVAGNPVDREGIAAMKTMAETLRRPYAMEQWQREIVSTWGDGDHAGLLDGDRITYADALSVMDGMLPFLLRETDPAEDCEGPIDAAERLSRTAMEISELALALADT